MKIIEQTATQLTLKDRPIFQWCVGALLVLQGGIFLGVALFLPMAANVSCVRTPTNRVDCEITLITLLRQQRTESLQGLKKATLQDPTSGTIQLARARIQTRLETEGVALAITPLAQAKFTVSRVRQFLTTPNRFILQFSDTNQRGYIIAAVLGLLLLSIGMLLVRLPMLICILDKQHNRMILKQRHLFGTKMIESPVATPPSLQVKRKWQNFRLMLEQHPISYNTLRKKTLEQKAETIRNFFEAPPQSPST